MNIHCSTHASPNPIQTFQFSSLFELNFLHKIDFTHRKGNKPPRPGTPLTLRDSHITREHRNAVSLRAAYASIHDAAYSVLSQRGIIDLKKGIYL